MVNKKGGKHKEGDGPKTGQAMQFNHGLGQHILKNPLIVQSLIDKVSCKKLENSLIII
jgi:hypothetical protein